MRFRWKLLILLLTIAVVPIAAMRTVGVRAVRTLAGQLIEQRRESLVAETEDRLRLVVDGYTQLLWQKRLQLEMALALQAGEIERVLAAQAPVDGVLLTPENIGADMRTALGTVASIEHTPVAGPLSGSVTQVSYRALVFYPGEAALMPAAVADAARLKAAVPFLQRLSGRMGDLVLWHVTALSGGATAVFPAHGRLADDFDGRRQPWYAPARDAVGRWSRQYADPLTGRQVMALAMPVRGPNGTTAGVTALVVPIDRLLEGRLLVQNLPVATRAFLVTLARRPGDGQPAARVLAAQDLSDPARYAWHVPDEPDWLVGDDPLQYQEVLGDFRQAVSNVRRVRYQGCDCLWVYGPVHQEAFLLLTTPYEQILAPAQAAEDFIQEQIERVFTVTRYMIGAVLVAVALLALAFARTVTRPLQALAEGTRRLAQGQLDTRVEIRSRDEFGEMGRVFNAVVPQLRDHWRVQQSLELAREVQQHFLPRRAPQVPGLDIAGRSVYCEQTGGDYFDYLDFGGDTDRIGVAVGDVAGHGIPSALLMTTVRALLRQRAALPGDLVQVITDVNLRVCRDIEESGQFVTLFLAELAPRTGALRWVRAGHEPALLYDAGRDRFEELVGEGTPLGISCEVRFDENRRFVRGGQILVLSTDGLHEARNPQGRMFGREPLREVLRAHAAESAEAILAAVFERLEAFQGPGARKEDDITVVVVKVL